ncbi:MAG: ATP-binding protein [Gemmatimonadota bacterium]
MTQPGDFFPAPADPHPEPGGGDRIPADVDARGFPLSFDIPSDLRYIESVVGLIRTECARRKLPARVCNLTVPVALAEALANAILYGNRESTSKRVRVRASLSERTLVMEVVDEGSGFDLDACTIDPTDPANLEREDGRGLYLMRNLMDRVERFTDDGNVVRLTLHHQ